jgi:hypothetical protein
MTLDGRMLNPGPGLIKIDVEGMEAEVIRGAQRAISEHRPVLYVENNGDESVALWSALDEIGYEGFWSIGTYFNRMNFFGNTANLWPSVVPSANVLAFHKGDALSSFGLTPLLGPDDNWQKALDRKPQQRRSL